MKKLFVTTRRMIVIVLFVMGTWVASAILLNAYLNASGKGKTGIFTDWTIHETVYSLRYIYWGKSSCASSTACDRPEEALTTHNVLRFGDEHKSESECLRIVFVGDSYTVGPWVEEQDMYASVVSKRLARDADTCVIQMRLATGGTGPDQQFQRMHDTLAQLRSDYVVWQFTQNDMYDTIQREIFQVVDDSLIRRSDVFTNMLFIAGAANQRIPGFSNTALGRHMLYMGELTDPFRYWATDLHDMGPLVEYFQTKVPYMLREIIAMGDEMGFQLYTTIAPLECDYVSAQDCWYFQALQDVAEQVLREHSTFVSMDTLTYTDDMQNHKRSTNYPHLFGPERDKNPTGMRHLTLEGNYHFGDVLGANMVKKLSP